MATPKKTGVAILTLGQIYIKKKMLLKTWGIFYNDKRMNSLAKMPKL